MWITLSGQKYFVIVLSANENHAKSSWSRRTLIKANDPQRLRLGMKVPGA
jgi:hypothetical protein